MALFIILIIFGAIFTAFGFMLIILPECDEGTIILAGIVILAFGIFSLAIGIDGVKTKQQSIKPIEYKQVIKTSPTLGKTKSNKDTIIYITDTTYLQK